jgi:RNA recognition motif-containing protein
MSSEYRPRRSGSRRPRSGRRQEGGFPSENVSTRKTSEPTKGFFAKILSWFTTKETKPNRSRSHSVTSTENTRSKEPRESKPARELPPAMNPEDLTTTKLYVGNLSYETVESDLFDQFSKIGAVKNVEVVMDRHQNRSKGFGFVEMEELSVAKQAIVQMNRTDFMGRQIIVSGAKAERREARDSSPTPSSSTPTTNPS